MNTMSYFSAKFNSFKIEFLPVISNFTYFSNNSTNEFVKTYKVFLDNGQYEEWQFEPPLRTLSCKVHPDGGQVLREVAIMAESSEGSTDLASLLRTNKVEALQATVFCGPVKFIVWTRLPEDNSSWILKLVSGFFVFSLPSLSWVNFI